MPLEDSIGLLTCAVAERLGAVLLGGTGAAQGRLRAGVSDSSAPDAWPVSRTAEHQSGAVRSDQMALLDHWRAERFCACLDEPAALGCLRWLRGPEPQ